MTHESNTPHTTYDLRDYTPRYSHQVGWYYQHTPRSRVRRILDWCMGLLG